MSRSRFRFHPEAIADAREARQWYRRRSERAAKGFLVELARAFQMIADRPKTWQAFPTGDRRFVLRKYPFVVAYRVADGYIQIVAVAHQRRRPYYWSERK